MWGPDSSCQVVTSTFGMFILLEECILELIYLFMLATFISLYLARYWICFGGEIEREVMWLPCLIAPPKKPEPWTLSPRCLPVKHMQRNKRWHVGAYLIVYHPLVNSCPHAFNTCDTLLLFDFSAPTPLCRNRKSVPYERYFYNQSELKNILFWNYTAW